MKRYKYYSFLQFKHFVKASCLCKKFSEVVEDEAIFMRILMEVNKYYTSHPQYVMSEEIGEFCGPQCHSDRFNLDKFHFYGTGQIKYYRWGDLLSLVYKDHPQEKATNNFLINPADEEVVTEERFEQYLKDINDNITTNYKIYTHLFVPYSGPQCNKDCKKIKCMQYTVKYKCQPVRKNVVLAEPKESNARETEWKETLENSQISLRVCEHCGVVCILGERAAAKYPLGSYEFKGQKLSLKFNCESLFKKTVKVRMIFKKFLLKM